MSESVVMGRCLCGAVRYKAKGAADHVCHCHCWMCQKHHGAAFATFAAYPMDGFRIIAGAEELRGYNSSPQVKRRFCGVCGSSLTCFHSGDPGRIWVTAGTLDGDPGRPVDGHIFVAEKAAWYTITDRLPQR